MIKMTLKELRNSKHITQNQAAIMLGVSLRSYKEYENDDKKKNTIKYNYMYDEINKLGFVDEEHGILSFEDIKEKVENVLKKREVKYCYLFGSYARGEAQEKSDVDLLVSTNITGMSFFGLAEELRENLHKKIDLINVDQLTNNIVLLDNILGEGIKIYG